MLPCRQDISSSAGVGLAYHISVLLNHAINPRLLLFQYQEGPTEAYLMPLS